MPNPVHRRDFDVFLSHAHDDIDFVVELKSFLQLAGLAVFVDHANMVGGADFPAAIQSGIERSQAAIIVATDQSIEQGWVKHEIGVALDEHARDDEFRLIPLRVAGAEVDRVIRGVSWIDVDAPNLTPSLASDLLRSFYPQDHRPDPRRSRDVYVSASWRDSDSASAHLVSRALRDQGFRLVGDSKDQEGFGDDRIERIIESCGAFVGVLPYRDGADEASAGDRPYKYFIREIDIAVRAGLPSVVIADPRVRRSDGDDSDWLRLPTDAALLTDEIEVCLADLWHEWQRPRRPHRVFLATDLDDSCASPSSGERQIVEMVTGLATVTGNEVNHDPVQRGIMELIRDAHLVIADLSGAEPPDFNLDVAIEAGMASVAGVNLRLIARGPARRPPFMLRTIQMPTYESDIERLALMHRIAHSFRRRIINAELSD